MPLPWNRNESSQLNAEEKQRLHTEKIAYELYQTRKLIARPGNHTTDWESAERIVQSRLRLLLYRLRSPEKYIWEPLLAWANDRALLSLLGLLGNISVVFAIVTYVGSEHQRRNAEVLNAWQTITSAYEQTGSGGRIQSLEFLNASPGANWRRRFPWFCAPVCTWPAESLEGINLAVEQSADTAVSSEADSISTTNFFEDRTSGVYLRDIKLPKAKLAFANLERADLFGANLWKADLSNATLRKAALGGADLRGADLSGAKLEGSILVGANIREADLSFSNLRRARIGEPAGAIMAGWAFVDDKEQQNTIDIESMWTANFEGANLFHADLREARLWSVNFKSADLSFANLESAELSNAKLIDVDLSHANLKYANLLDTDLRGANLTSVNLKGVNQVKKTQLSQAKLCNTYIPNDIDLSPYRDCEELGIEPLSEEVLELIHQDANVE